MKTILLAYEERPVARRVLERTAELAKAFDAKVIVTSVARAPPHQGARDPGIPQIRRHGIERRSITPWRASARSG